jgi:hypothetical protein
MKTPLEKISKRGATLEEKLRAAAADCAPKLVHKCCG